jgi:hypothetical protein
MSTKLVTLLIASALASGCVTRDEPRTKYYSASVVVSAPGAPDLVYVSPGVHVIANYGEPIFFANGLYWFNVDGLWFRSQRYTGGWAYVSRPPTAIARIQHPYAYRYYRPPNYVVRNRPVPVNRIERPIVRVHRVDVRG